MNCRSPLFVRTACAAAFLATGGIAWAGSLEPPPGPVEPTMKTLAQVEARTPIHQSDLPLTLTAPGAYYLAENLNANQNGVDMITVTAENVSIDLNGFTIKGTSAIAVASDCIEITPTVKSFALRDGVIRDCGQSGVFTTNNGVVTVSVHRVQAIHNGGSGLLFVIGTSGVISESVASNNGERGILLGEGVIQNSVTMSNGSIGVQVQTGLIRGCVSKFNGIANLFAGGLVADTLAP